MKEIATSSSEEKDAALIEAKQSLQVSLDENASLKLELQEQTLLSTESKKHIESLQSQLSEYKEVSSKLDQELENVRDISEKLIAAEKALEIATESATAAHQMKENTEELYQELKKSFDSVTLMNAQLKSSQELLQKQVEELR